MSEKKRIIIWLGFACLVYINLIAWEFLLGSTNLKVTFFDVGQGDAIFIETPQGQQILIDGGPDNSVVEKLDKTLPFWDKSLDLVVLTHADADHITGLVPVLEDYKIDSVLWTGVEKNTNIFTAWKDALLNENSYVAYAEALQKIFWSQNKDQEYIEILYPNRAAIENVKAVNDTSIIARLVFGEHSFLFTGDISDSVERELVRSNADIDADILKIPHHGSKSSNSSVFLSAVTPELGIIQVGAKNRYGHPTKEALDRLASIPVLRTDKNGDIVIETNGTEFSYQYK